MLLRTNSTSTLYCVAMTKAPGAAGKVPYKKPKVLNSVVSLKSVPACMIFTV